MIVEIVVYGSDGTPKYSGWQILESKEENEKTYVTKIIHAGSPENFAYYYTGTKYDNRRVEYILSSGKIKNSSLTSNIPTKTRNWDKYKDQSKLDLIDSVRCMTYDDAYKITNNTSVTNDQRRKTEASYWLCSANYDFRLWFVNFLGYMSGGDKHCFGVRPVVSLKSGVYIKAGTGIEADPYILGKD